MVLERDAIERLYRELCESLASEGIIVLSKAESRFSKLIDGALRVITFGGQARFMTEFVTTLGKRIYTPTNWDSHPPGDRYLILRHEAVHVRQFKRWTWPGMTLVYLLLPLPMGLAGGRTWLEWEAYRETITATWQLYGEAAARGLEDHIAERFTSADYAWMWLPGRQVRRWIARLLADLERNPPPPLSPSPSR